MCHICCHALLGCSVALQLRVWISRNQLTASEMQGKHCGAESCNEGDTSQNFYSAITIDMSAKTSPIVRCPLMTKLQDGLEHTDILSGNCAADGNGGKMPRTLALKPRISLLLSSSKTLQGCTAQIMECQTVIMHTQPLMILLFRTRKPPIMHGSKCIGQHGSAQSVGVGVRVRVRITFILERRHKTLRHSSQWYGVPSDLHAPNEL